MPTLKPLSRRTVLRGAGRIAIALPFLEEMAAKKAHAADAPLRCVTMFFGLGLSGENQQEGFSGSLQPFAPFQNKMALFTNVDMSQAAGGTAHFEGSPVVFVGEKKRGEDRSGGASIDQLMKRGLHPNGPPTVLGSLATGLWFREGCACQPLRCWNDDGSVAERPLRRPSLVFDRLFGALKPPPATPGPNTPPPDAEQLRQQHIKRSVLDTVLGEYQHLAGDASYLGAASKQKLQNHLERIRELERRLFPAEQIIDGADPTEPQNPVAGMCQVPTPPKDPNLDGVSYDLKGATDRNAPTMSHQAFGSVVRLQAELFALAMRCDLVRFGNFLCESAGGHVKFTGTYNALGDSLAFKGDTSEHAGFWHGNDTRSARLCSHMFISHLAYFLQLLDDPDHKEANGKTVLDNAVVVIGTEVGWNHSLKPVFHAIAGGGGRFRPGTYGQAINCVDIYNAVLTSSQLKAEVGQRSNLQRTNIGGLLA